jgi:hypothetical protein
VSGGLVVVIAPETSEEASRLFSALLAAGFHPSIDYGDDSAAGGRLANYPILAPQSELAEARAFLKGLAVRPAPGAPVRPIDAAFGAHLSDRPVGPIPPWKFSETAGKALGVLLAMIALVGGIVVLVKMLEYLTSLKGR